MGEVNVLLKRIFTIFNVIFALVGGVILGLALLSQVMTNSHGDLAQRASGLLVLYLVGSFTVVIAVLGAFGAHRENKGCLIAFLVCTLIGGLLMIRLGVPAAANRSSLEPLLKKAFEELVPLDHRTQPNVQNVISQMQSKLHCCGIFNYKDWKDTIPESCECDMEAKEQGKCMTITYKGTHETIYSQPCFPIMFSYVAMVADIFIGVMLTLAVLAILGVILSSIMIHQMRTRGMSPRPTVLLSVPTVYAPAPPRYEKLNNPPTY